MLIPKIVAALLAVRQLDQVLPASYCAPECPSCRTEVIAFDKLTACVANSPFIRDCSICQQCILTYNINNGQTSAALQLESNMVDILNLCQNSTVAGEIQELQSDASRISGLASTTTSSLTTTAPTPAITSPPTLTTSYGGQDRNYSDGSWTTKCAVEPVPSWCSRRSSRLSASIAAALANATANASPTPPPPPPIEEPQPLNLSWIAGPIVGSIMGIMTVIIVIIFTRRKQDSQQPPPSPSSTKNDFDSESMHSEPLEKAQLHSECVEPKELEACEVAELPALEPVGNEMLTPKDGKGRGEEDWPLPISPLPALFVASELRDQRMGVVEDESPKHETFYHP